MWGPSWRPEDTMLSAISNKWHRTQVNRQSQESLQGADRVYVYVMLPIIVPLPGFLAGKPLLAEVADKSVAAGSPHFGLLPR